MELLNPPAFPFSCEREIAPGTTIPHLEPGMSLRDYFAGQALAGVMAAPSYDGVTFDSIAAHCFAVADAMLAERKKGGVS